jgi:hypothetical protein
MRTHSWGWTGTVLLLFTVGCSATGVAPDPDAAARAQRALAAASAAQREFVRIEQQIVNLCLDKAGVTNRPPDPPVDPALENRAPQGVSPAIADAEREGYGLARPATAAPGSARYAEKQRAWEALPQAEQRRVTEAIFGKDSDAIFVEVNGDTVSINSSGCLSEVRAKMYGDLKQWLRLSEIASNQVRMLSNRDLGSDRAWTEALREWSSCMSDEGFRQLASPGDARDAAQQGYETAGRASPDARQKEIRIATADARCAASTGLQRTYDAAFARVNARVLVENETDLVEWQNMVSGALTRGRAALAGP